MLYIPLSAILFIVVRALLIYYGFKALVRLSKFSWKIMRRAGSQCFRFGKWIWLNVVHYIKWEINHP